MTIIIFYKRYEHNRELTGRSLGRECQHNRVRLEYDFGQSFGISIVLSIKIYKEY